MSLKTPPAASASGAAHDRREKRRGSVLSVMPQITMPPREDWIRFWRARAGAGANQDQTQAQRLDLLVDRLKEVQTSFDTVRHRSDMADPTDRNAFLDTLRREHAALTELQQHLSGIDRRLTHLRAELDGGRRAFLAAWRVTDRQILSTEARALSIALQDLMHAVKCHQVDLTGKMIDLG